jgi:hypothetical protein
MAPMNSDLRAIFIALAIFIVLFGAGIVFDYAEWSRDVSIFATLGVKSFSSRPSRKSMSEKNSGPTLQGHPGCLALSL